MPPGPEHPHVGHRQVHAGLSSASPSSGVKLAIPRAAAQRSMPRSAAARPSPHPPLDARRRQPARPAGGGERVHERVRRRVVRLARASRVRPPPRSTSRRSRAAGLASRCRFQRPPPSGRSATSELGPGLSCSVPSSSTPAACTIPRNGGRLSSIFATTRATSSLRETSASTTSTCAPRARIAPMAARAASEGGRRPASARHRAPRATSRSAVSRPSPERPPVTRYDAPGTRLSSEARTGSSCTSTTLPTCLACAMARKASAMRSRGNTCSGSGESPEASPRTTASKSAMPAGPPGAACSGPRCDRPRADAPAGTPPRSRSRLPISRNRPSGARQRTPAAMKSPASELSSTSTPRPPVAASTWSPNAVERGIEDVGHAKGTQGCALTVAPGGGEDDSSGVLGDLNGGHTHTARARVDEHRLTLENPAPGKEGMVCRHESERHRGGFGMAHSVRQWCDEPRVCSDVGGEATFGNREDIVADRYAWATSPTAHDHPHVVQPRRSDRVARPRRRPSRSSPTRAISGLFAGAVRTDRQDQVRSSSARSRRFIACISADGRLVQPDKAGRPCVPEPRPPPALSAELSSRMPSRSAACIARCILVKIHTHRTRAPSSPARSHSPCPWAPADVRVGGRFTAARRRRHPQQGITVKSKGAPPSACATPSSRPAPSLASTACPALRLVAARGRRAAGDRAAQCRGWAATAPRTSSTSSVSTGRPWPGVGWERSLRRKVWPRGPPWPIVRSVRCPHRPRRRGAAGASASRRAKGWAVRRLRAAPRAHRSVPRPQRRPFKAAGRTAVPATASVRGADRRDAARYR